MKNTDNDFKEEASRKVTFVTFLLIFGILMPIAVRNKYSLDTIEDMNIFFASPDHVGCGMLYLVILALGSIVLYRYQKT